MKNVIQNNGLKKAVIYCRVSSKEQVDEGNSLVSQERICREYAAKEGYEVVEIFIEKGESAKTAKRKELQRMLAHCTTKKGSVQAVIAYKVDRISRNIADYSYIRVKLKKYAVEIKSVTEYFEDTPAGRFMENIIANVGQFDNDVRAERCSEGMRGAMIEGRYVWMAPTGYTNAKVNGKSTIIQNSHAALIREAFELIASRQHSTEAIRLKMLKKGLVTKHGRPIQPGHFFRLIRNPIYKGIIKKFGETHNGSYNPIVSEKLFDEVQLILKGRVNKTKAYLHENPDFPLRRFVLNEDGKQLTGYWSKGKYKKYPYYSFHLPGTTIRKEALEEKYMALLTQYTFDTRHLNVIKENLVKHFGTQSTNHQNGREAIQSRIVEINQKIDSLIALQTQGSISANILTDRVQKLEDELEELTSLLNNKQNKEVNIPGLMRFAAEALKEPCLLWQKSPLEIRRKLQVFDFPKGVIFNGEKFRTPKVCSIYKLKREIDGGKFLRVDSRFSGKNTQSNINMPPSAKNILETKEYWETIVSDLKELQHILTPESEKIHPLTKDE